MEKRLWRAGRKGAAWRGFEAAGTAEMSQGCGEEVRNGSHWDVFEGKAGRILVLGCYYEDSKEPGAVTVSALLSRVCPVLRLWTFYGYFFFPAVSPTRF